MAKCETEIDTLRGELESDIRVFRWLWVVNLAAIVWGIILVHYDVLAIGAVSAIISMIGIGQTRRGRKAVDRAGKVCVEQLTEKS